MSRITGGETSFTQALEQSNLLFVYGTLQSGYGNNRWCLGGAKSLGARVTEDKFILGQSGIPFMIPDGVFIDAEEYLLNVEGELFEINADHMSQTDVLEGHPEAYVRELIKTTEGETCWAYLWKHGVRNGMYLSPVTEEGNYKWSNVY